MTRYIQTECPKCESSDAFTVYDDGAHCFSCNYSTKKVTKEMNDFNNLTASTPVYNTNKVQEIADLNSFALASRGISKTIVDHFGIKMAVNPDGSGGSHYYPYTKQGKVVAYKERQLPKDFRIHGEFRDIELFGQANSTGGKTVVITEGELDACAVAQAFYDKYNRVYPVVAIPSASGTKVLLEQRSWLRKFETVILMMDQDEAGQAAVEQAAKIIGAGKVKVAKLPEKDPCEPIWDQFKARQEVESIPYPECLEGLNNKLQGIRHGEITLFTSGTGSGKSTVIKEIALDLLAKTDDKIGLISLEESVGDTAEKFIGMALKRSSMDLKSLPDEQLREGFEQVFKNERLVLLDHQGSCSDTSLLDKIEYMALMGCKYLILDHITIAVSEGAEGLGGNEAVDKLMSDLLKIVKKHNVWLGLISHLRKAPGGGKSFEEGNLASIDDIKGSGSIKQISFAFARNLVSEDEAERNTIKFRVLKSRFTGQTGSAGAAVYSTETGRLTYALSEDFVSL